ncbi:MAG: sulfatase [Bacteroidota bacterium]
MKGIPVLLLALLSLAACQPAATTDPTPPNFVFFLVDDMGWADLGCYGSTFYETPNIDRLAAEGIRFTQAYAACPVCSPTRASIMSGKYPARTGVTDWIPGRQNRLNQEPGHQLSARPFAQQMALEEITIAEALQAAGYQTCFVGKWHLGTDSIYWPEHQGFDLNIGGHNRGSPPGGYFSPYNNPRLSDGPEGEYLTDRLTTESLHFLDTVGKDPFLLYFSFYTVHNPMQGKDSLVGKYEQKRDQLGHSEADRFDYDADWIRKAPERGNFRQRNLQDHATYASMVESLDQNVGRVLDKLAEVGKQENTVVIFMSDNGGLSTSEGSPTVNGSLRTGKGWLYEGGIREPMMIRWPNVIAAGQTSEVPVTSTDFYPTMLQMADLPLQPEQHQDGVSLLPLLAGNQAPQREAIFWHYPHYSNQGGRPGSVIRKGRYKLIEFLEGPSLELYDLEADPGETNNLAEQETELTQSLQAELQTWRAEVGAEMMDPNPAFDPTYERPSSK